MVNEIFCETVLRDRGADQSWQRRPLFYEFSILKGRKSSSAGWKPAWLSKDLLLKQNSKKEILSMEAGTGDLEII